MDGYVIVLAIFLLFEPNAARENPCVDNYTWRIIGGQTAPPGEFPFMAYLRNESDGFWGGASILNSQWLITAAHCVEGYTIANLSVVVGTNRISTGGTPHNLSRIIPHPIAENDIALLKLETELTFDNLTQPIEIGEGTDNETCIQLGWGLAKWGFYPDELQFLTSRVTPREECESYWEDLMDTQICALVGEGAGSCCGDSGGPLVAGGKLVGVMSYGLPCALGAPDLFTRVAAFEEWIMETVK